jgi:MFS family permease
MVVGSDVRRNTLILWGATALMWALVVLVASLTTLTVGHLFERPELAGLAFGAYLLAYASGSMLFGRLLDRLGRRVGLAIAFAVSGAGALVIFLGVTAVWEPLFVAGLMTVGLGNGGANLTRVAGADMYPPERRARGIALVVFGAAFGAIGAPIMFGPVLAGARALDAQALAAPWPIGAIVMFAGAVLLLAMRVDPRRIAEQLAQQGVAGPPTRDPVARPMATLLAQPMVPLAVIAAVVSQAVMTSMMAMAGLVMADHGHDLGAVSLTVSLHFVGMFGLVLVVGRLVELIGRLRAVVVGLLTLAGGVLLLLPAVELLNFMPGMFAIGVGWNIAFVASTTILADAARSTERGRLLGTSDFLAMCGAATLSVLAGIVLTIAGVEALVVVNAALAIVPALLILAARKRLGREAIA